MIPPRLSRKDTCTIGVFAPSEPLTDNRWARIESVSSLLEKNGFRTKYSKRIRSLTYDTAGSVAVRVEAISELLDDEEVDVLFGAWGGRACIELLPHLAYSQFRERRKPIFGASDVAVLLNGVTAQSGLMTYFGPNVFGKLDEVPLSHLNFLRNPDAQSHRRELLPDTADGSITIRTGKVSGRLFGGSLDTFVHANAGTEFSIEPAGNILFWETSKYDPQLIRQKVMSLKIRRVLDRVGGVVIGDVGVRPEGLRWAVPEKAEFLSGLFSGLDCPVLYCPVFGHARVFNPVLPIGARCHLDAQKATLQLDEDIIEMEST